ncbi:DUF397 domain-containing protein [Actinomadura madurae]|uniref:DUF397 domain-containing protein n=1 Tax=Actinomadura madurae TaxID=1993 RepID=UPI0020D2427B|nr:DUF397 domain-containing protein [Actinomadura madurae]MCP9947210.1 DUF397 domain-containing protein [Actinomadura madurae]MCP9963975.1 DUF397 domain-containing protein [Actinomadura madurae]MCP9976450.1 DUF397 domain-containing protein [Actinomadura madurae]MCQ0012057.1 DUF397 domain-containing protein [Actinomadura madurae]MCQ0012643.1 DUF397 domain-containing protein [Actinomadura madurae]
MHDLTEGPWRKARACGASNTCVEVGHTPAAVLVRDSADPDGARVALTRAGFAGLLAAIKDGRRG